MPGLKNNEKIAKAIWRIAKTNVALQAQRNPFHSPNASKKSITATTNRMMASTKNLIGKNLKRGNNSGNPNPAIMAKIPSKSSIPRKASKIVSNLIPLGRSGDDKLTSLLTSSLTIAA
jgi:hypothetical protein